MPTGIRNALRKETAPATEDRQRDRKGEVCILVPMPKPLRRQPMPALHHESPAIEYYMNAIFKIRLDDLMYISNRNQSYYFVRKNRYFI